MSAPGEISRSSLELHHSRQGGYPVWSASTAGAEIRFVGLRENRTARQTASEVADGLGDVPADLAWAQQVHTARVLDAAPGPCGEGDALSTERKGLALTVVTADCVPVVVAGEASLAVVHAGWRGIVAGIVEGAVHRLPEPASQLTAWIGPAIGVADYEVGEDVAEQVVEASSPEVARRRRGAKPHLDLVLAVSVQLRRRGLDRIASLDLSTYSDPRLASYRRDGSGAGRNVALAWLRA